MERVSSAEKRPDTTKDPAIEDGAARNAQALAEEVQASDAQSSGSGDVHEYANRVDRSVIINSWMKSAAQFSLRMLIIVVLVGAGLYLMGKFWAGVLPVILALIVCTVLSPITNGLRRIKVPGGLAALASLLVFFAVLVFFVAIILPDILRNSRVLVIQAGQGIQGLQLWLQNQETLPFDINAEQLDSIVQDLATWIQNKAGAIAGGIFSGISTATSMSITLVIVVVLTFFFLKDGPKFLPWVRSATGGRAGLHATELLTRAWETLGGYVRAQALVSLIDAIFIGLGIWIVGVPMAFTLSVITFMAGFIPLVGAIVAGTLAVLIALVSLGFTEALITLGIVIAVQQLEGNVLSPLLQSRAMNLHPVIILVSVTVGGGLFGLVGAFLAVPVAAMLAVVFRYTQDIVRLHAGEVSASDLTFATDVGRALAEAEERESNAERDELMEQRIWTPPTLEEESVEEPEQRQATGSTLVKQVRSINLRSPKNWKFENPFGSRGRGTDDVS